jgi:GMP synthase (glutamine-hydrolysing)
LLLVVDNGSIYTKQLTDFLNQKKIIFEKFSPENLNLDSLNKYESIIFQ